jgi:hypothetical protein
MYERIVNWFFFIVSLALVIAVGYMLITMAENQAANRERSGVVLPIGSIGTIELRQLPQIQLVARDVIDPGLEQMHEMDVALARVVTRRGFGRIKPLLIELPDTDWKTGDTRPVTYALPLPETQTINISGLQNYYLAVRETRPTICLAIKAAYSWQSFEPALQKLKDWMSKNNTVPTGRPRILLYSLQSFIPDDWKEFEVQIPVR